MEAGHGHQVTLRPCLREDGGVEVEVVLRGGCLSGCPREVRRQLEPSNCELFGGGHAMPVDVPVLEPRRHATPYVLAEHGAPLIAHLTEGLHPVLPTARRPLCAIQVQDLQNRPESLNLDLLFGTRHQLRWAASNLSRRGHASAAVSVLSGGHKLGLILLALACSLLPPMAPVGS